VVAGGENEIVLHEPTVVRGTVTDAATGKAVEAFRLVLGVQSKENERTIWERSAYVGAEPEQLVGKNGKSLLSG
jgi:hypothetical protein